MNIDSLTITAFVVFVIALVMFVKNCFMNSCILPSDRKVHNDSAGQFGDEQ